MYLRHGRVFYIDSETKEIVEIGDCRVTPERDEFSVDDVYQHMCGYMPPVRIHNYGGHIEFSEKTRKLTILNVLAACGIQCSNNYLKMHGGVIHRKKARKKKAV